jgi:2-amino-4-hydroxy-6-hydroxymethyldihydropteridine diphosphokinase
MNRAFLSIASNIRPEQNILKAIGWLAEPCRVLTVSRCFVTEAIPAADRRPTGDLPHFINCVALLETAYGAREFKHEILRPLEQVLGRVRTDNKYAPRPIDLDLLLFNEEMYAEDGLTIPDPDIFTRWFLAQGILDIDDGVRLPNVTAPFRTHLSSIQGLCFPVDADVPENHQLRRDILALIGADLTS